MQNEKVLYIYYNESGAEARCTHITQRHEWKQRSQGHTRGDDLVHEEDGGGRRRVSPAACGALRGGTLPCARRISSQRHNVRLRKRHLRGR